MSDARSNGPDGPDRPGPDRRGGARPVAPPVAPASQTTGPARAGTGADDASAWAAHFELLVSNITRVIQGKDDVVRLALLCFVAEGHLLVEDVPGTGKTSLARAIAASVDLTWNRIQFTPDLLPSDVTGVPIFNQATHDFVFRPGAVFANIVIGDEINRASPKTQSALLEVMEEGTVTIDGVVYPVPMPFMVIATQNPIDMEGTYKLPEAQLDRFLMKLELGYPDARAEARVLEVQKNGHMVDRLEAVLNQDDMQAMIRWTHTVEVAPAIVDYIVAIAHHTRTAPEVRLGVSPRGSLALLRASRAAALASGRLFVTPEDVKALAPAVLAHRIIVTPEAELQKRSGTEVVQRALQAVAVPRAVATG
jgi:MoxR-like ATPase